MNIFFWANYITGGILFIYLLGVFATFILKPRFAELPKILCAAIPMLFSAVPTYIRITHPDTSLFSRMGYLQALLIITYLIIFFSDNWQKKTLILLILFSILSVSESASISILSSRGLKFNYSFSTYEMFIHQSLTYTIALILWVLIYLIWKSFSKTESFPRSTGLFLLFPLSQLLLFWGYPEAMLTDKDLNVNSIVIVGILMTFLADIVSFYVLLSYGDRESMIRQIDELKKLHEIEQQHFSDVEQQDIAIAKVRHDIRNQLAVITDLMDTGNDAEAELMLHQIIDRTNSASGKKWCGNHIVNALLSEKEMICTSNGVSLDVDVNIGELPSIQPVHMCSAFSNMIDNAISAASKCSPDQKTVIIHSSVSGDYLHIKVSNHARSVTAPHAPASALHEHGHGQEILRDIASCYHGSFITDYIDGIYTALLVLDLKTDESTPANSP